jgi:hypothetical protein
MTKIGLRPTANPRAVQIHNTRNEDLDRPTPGVRWRRFRENVLAGWQRSANYRTAIQSTYIVGGYSRRGPLTTTSQPGSRYTKAIPCKYREDRFRIGIRYFLMLSLMDTHYFEYSILYKRSLLLLLQNRLRSTLYTRYFLPP